MTYQDACKHKTEDYGTIYLITNTINDKCYVGQTVQPLTERLKQHKWHGHQTDTKSAIHQAMLKHGFDAFVFEILGVYPNQDELDKAELHFALTLNSFVPMGYNRRAGSGRGSCSEETKLKIGVGGLGRVTGEETKTRLSEARTEWHANRSEETETERRRKISEAKAETYLFRSPSGEKVEVTNLKQWCADNGFTKTQWCKMALVAVGKDRSVKGWSLWENPGEETGTFRKMEWELRSPSGDKVVVTSMKDFCAANGLNNADWVAMRKLTTGVRKSPVQGWSLWETAQ